MFDANFNYTIALKEAFKTAMIYSVQLIKSGGVMVSEPGR
jgi:hypothetical protein